MPVISLTGFMGSGKTSVGKELAILLDWDFFDLDAMIVERDGRAVSRIFAEDGEQAFRETESAVLRHFFRYRNSPVYHSRRGSVLALGGGTILRPDAVKLIRKYSTCVYLQASFETLLDNLSDDFGSRPLLSGSRSLRERIDELMSAREGAYRAAADVCVVTDGLTPAQAAEKIAEVLQDLSL